MPRRVAILQSSYVPWKGYFDVMRRADAFVLLDDVQYTRRDWRNRNRIKTADGLRWLTIPVTTKGRYHAPIQEIRVADPAWAERHWATIARAYGRAPAFDAVAERLETLYREAARRDHLSDVNRLLLEGAASLLGIDTPLTWSREYDTEDDATGRLLSICRQLGAAEYLSGPSARAYLDVERFAAAGVAVTWMDYEGYPEYPQLHAPFEHAVSIVDPLVHLGDDAPRCLDRTGPSAEAGSPPRPVA